MNNLITSQPAVILPAELYEDLLEKLSTLERRVQELEDNLDEDIKGTEAAAKFAGISVRTLQSERERPGTLIVYKKVGRSVSYSRQSIIAFKNEKRHRRNS
jgi:predicted phage-related endonuclease